eukprot:Blabericola_migrator_1__3954@NODE_219_length_11213_cov_124_951821_g186_i0_p6_GENE_NODE_219_length_11213_cov_124_951821_g186_i0NODE_219_length_11213_cov_124_951821_g186_i0_p6_ORF_typecomplete_len370_score76_18_NODE_219_length_11213_cov_124_951821_g186_i055296638
MGDRLVRSPLIMGTLCSYLTIEEMLKIQDVSKSAWIGGDLDFWKVLFSKRFTCCVPCVEDTCTTDTPCVIDKEVDTHSLTIKELMIHFVYHPYRRLPITNLSSRQPGCYGHKYISLLSWELGGLPYGLRPLECGVSFMSAQVTTLGLDLNKFGFDPNLNLDLNPDFDVIINFSSRPKAHWRCISLHFFDDKGNETRNVVFIALTNKTGKCQFRLGDDLISRPSFIEIVMLEDVCAGHDEDDCWIEIKESVEMPQTDSLIYSTESYTQFPAEAYMTLFDEQEQPTPPEMFFEEFWNTFDFKLDYFYGIRNIERSFCRHGNEAFRLLSKVFDARKQKISNIRFTKKKHTDVSCLDNYIEATAIKLKGHKVV